MDWFFDSTDEAAFRGLRGEFLAYLERHGDGGGLFESQLVFEELVGNAVRHAAGPVWVSVDWGGEQPLLTVYDLGAGFDLDEVAAPDALSESHRGLFLVSAYADELHVAHRHAGGTRAEARLPTRRRREEDEIEVPGPDAASLPAPDEAAPDGTFDREAFLRALVVELSQTLELEHGPAAAGRAVARVGVGVGGRMEEEYRRARDLVGRLSPDDMADLFLRLKHAIEGGFYLVELDDERIVLANTRCPFGEAVRRAPALCRMTSSVFGGIAARNVGESAVQLEERIAVGDPQCRVTVWLRRPSAEEASSVHRYRVG